MLLIHFYKNLIFNIFFFFFYANKMCEIFLFGRPKASDSYQKIEFQDSFIILHQEDLTKVE